MVHNKNMDPCIHRSVAGAAARAAVGAAGAAAYERTNERENQSPYYLEPVFQRPR